MKIPEELTKKHSNRLRLSDKDVIRYALRVLEEHILTQNEDSDFEKLDLEDRQYVIKIRKMQPKYAK